MIRVDIEQGSQEWLALRWGKITGTSMKDAIGTPTVQKSLTYKIVAERMTEPQSTELNSPAVLRGIELEPMARLATIQATGIEFEETGMLLSETIDGVGFSPDGIHERDGVVVGGLEIKCPGSNKHVEYMAENTIPKAYAAQVMTPFLLSDEVESWHFVSYDDRNYERPIFILKVTREDFPKIEEDREKLLAFIARVNDLHEQLTF
jgi:putative phage-type endonuclease